MISLPTEFDVLVVGGGAAGLYAALRLPSHYAIGILTKDPLTLSASDWAQGGIAAAIAPDDAADLHIHDTLTAGAGLCDFDAVQVLVEKAPDCVQTLIDMGVAFDRHGSNLALTLEAAHSRRRVLHAADTTGRAVITTLVKQALQHPNIHIIPEAFAIDLWLDETTRTCQGVKVLYHDHLTWIRAATVLLATGGGGQVFAQTTNPALSTGDGVAMAWRAGAQVRDLEFVQFHPTALTYPGAPHFLISEAVRGEGAHLINDQGDRFVFDYHPSGELAPRDVVSRAIYQYLQGVNAEPMVGSEGSPLPPAYHVWLDLRPIPPDTIQRRFPNIIQVCKQWGIDVFQAPIPVAPAAHYWMGGVTTDLTSQTSIAGLYAVGETASTGVHGANRLASNSLLECLVFSGQLAALDLPKGAKPQASLTTSECSSVPVSIAELALDRDRFQAWRTALQQQVWQGAGICRDQDSMAAAIDQIKTWREDFEQLPLTGWIKEIAPTQSLRADSLAFHLRPWGELRNLLDIAYLILRSAQFRTESRGGHYRQDYPQTSPLWQAHTLVEGDRFYRSSPLDKPKAKA